MNIEDLIKDSTIEDDEIDNDIFEGITPRTTEISIPNLNDSLPTIQKVIATKRVAELSKLQSAIEDTRKVVENNQFSERFPVTQATFYSPSIVEVLSEISTRVLRGERQCANMFGKLAND